MNKWHALAVKWKQPLAAMAVVALTLTIFSGWKTMGFHVALPGKQGMISAYATSGSLRVWRRASSKYDRTEWIWRSNYSGASMNWWLMMDFRSWPVEVGIPLWFFWLPPLAIANLGRWTQLHAWMTGRCRKCKYLMKDLPRCPECGWQKKRRASADELHSS